MEKDFLDIQDKIFNVVRELLIHMIKNNEVDEALMLTNWMITINVLNSALNNISSIQDLSARKERLSELLQDITHELTKRSYQSFGGPVGSA